VTGTGNSLKVTVSLAFKSGFGGPKTIYLYGLGLGGQNSGWQSRGAWTVPTGAAMVTADSVSPASGSGTSVSLTATYSSTAGYTNLNWGLMRVLNSGSSGAGECYVGYQRGSNAFYLANDAANGWVPTSLLAGSGGSIQNSQCVLNGSGSTVTGTGNSLKVTVSLAFKSGFGGPKTIYLYGLSLGGQNSGWQSRGAWTVP
jgi:hypothetical protein